MTPVDAMGLAIFFFEGGNQAKPTTRNIRNLNPGNLRPYQLGQTQDADGYRVFPSFVEGWSALVSDINYKLKYHMHPTDTLLDFFALYAPAGDHNNPTLYARFVCSFMSGALRRVITLDNTIAEIFG